MNASVGLNGKKSEPTPTATHPFRFDVTDKISLTGTNCLAVKIANEGENSRWYSGSGIYRHVWLRFLNPVHVAHDGIEITTPQMDSTSAQVRVRMRVANQGPSATPIRVVNRVLNSQGEDVAHGESQQTIAVNDSLERTQELAVQNASLWSLQHPLLYTNVTEI